jgi:hypothetical protein
MLALLGSLAGFLSSLIPEIFNFIKDKRDKGHELEIIRLQIEASKAKTSSRLEEVKIHADSMDNRTVYNHAKPIGISWVDALSASVRPFITYSFFLLYIVIKVIIVSNYHPNISLPIWSDEDQGLFSAIMCFWFGSRVFSRR